MCSTFGSVKFLKLLRFNKNISHLGLTLRMCVAELASFTVLFFIVWFAFVQIMYLVYGDDLASYSTLTKSMETAFQVMLGKFDVNDMSMSQPVLGPIIFSMYNVVVIFFALNIFITIIMDAFEKVRERAKANPHREFDFLRYAFAKIRNMFQRKEASLLASPDRYKNHLSVFPSRIDALINYFYRVNNAFLLNQFLYHLLIEFTF